MTTVQAALTAADIPPREATLLLAQVAGAPREWLLAHPDAPLSKLQAQQFSQLLTQYQRGQPLPYLLGEWEFFGLQFRVTPDVLIPRPETELLVERALAMASGIARPAIADIGTGSGIIAVTLAVKLPAAHVVAVDISGRALEVARANAIAHGAANRIHFVQSDLLASLTAAPTPFDLICANLPYIASAELAQLDVARHEPRTALDGGANGLDLIDRLLATAPPMLKAGGSLLLEIGAGQGDATLALAKRYMPTATARVLSDLAELDRLLEVVSQS